MAATGSREFPKWLRVVIPTLLFVVWFAVSGIGGPYFGKISDVISNDQASFLPANAESTKVRDQLSKFQDQNSIPALLVFTDDGKQVSTDTQKQVNTAVESVAKLDGVTGVSPPIVSDDKQALLAVVNANTSVDYKKLIPAIRTTINDAKLPVSMQITGPLGALNDLAKAFSGIDGILLLAAVAVVFVILLIVYRSPLLPFIVLFTALSALTASILAVYYLAKAGVLTINGQVQGILFILVIGAATDYSLLYIARYREELHRHEYPYQAIIAAWRRSVEPIAAAGGTVMVGLLCLLLSDLNSNKALGPVGALGIVMAILAALTLLPSILMAFGRVAFWPRKPKFVSNDDKLIAPLKGLWPSTARFVAKRPRAIWVTTTLLLLICAAGIINLRANGVSDSALILGKSEARDGQQVIDEHYSAGSGTPTYAIVTQNSTQDIVSRLDKDSGVSSVSVTATGTPTGMLPLGKDENQLPIYLRENAKPVVADGKVLLDITLSDNPDSLEAQSTIDRLRSVVKSIDGSAQIGGTTATKLDTNTAGAHDRNLIIPVVLIVITLILMLLLRSLVAPVILLLTTILSFGASLGVSAVIFNNVFRFPGADASVVLYAFVFLVALGIDYNIFLMTRVREESLRRTTKKGVLVGLVVTGGVITSAGVVLAATFAALSVIPILFLAQLAFVVSFGVLLDTIIVRSLLVPAAIYDIGSAAWWPSSKRK